MLGTHYTSNSVEYKVGLKFIIDFSNRQHFKCVFWLVLHINSIEKMPSVLVKFVLCLQAPGNVTVQPRALHPYPCTEGVGKKGKERIGKQSH